jgi:hypothetical protein
MLLPGQGWPVDHSQSPLDSPWRFCSTHQTGEEIRAHSITESSEPLMYTIPAQNKHRKPVAIGAVFGGAPCAVRMV